MSGWRRPEITKARKWWIERRESVSLIPMTVCDMQIDVSPEDEARFLDLVFQNPANRALFERLCGFDLPNWMLVSGCLFQTVWNVLDGRAPAAGIRDYDLFYHDESDLSYEAEDLWIKRVDALTRDIGVPVETRNQARVHLWFEDHFGEPCPPFTSPRDSIRRFLSPTCSFGLYAGEDGSPRVFAPYGFADLYDRVVRPNPIARGGTHYAAKAERWGREWPSLTILPWQTE